MKKLWIWFAVFSTLLSAQETRLPEEFTVAERLFSPFSTFEVNTDLYPLAIARKRIFSLTSAFDLEDPLGKPLASACARFFAWGTVADVMDPEGKKIGWIEEELVRILPWAEYRVFNHENRLAAIAKMNFWGTSFELYPPDHPEEVYAVISRPFIRIFRDYWTVQIRNLSVFEENWIDPRLLILLAVFQSDKDARDRMRADVLDFFRREFDDFEGSRW